MAGNSLLIKNPFKDLEEKFLTAIEQYWVTYGALPTVQKLIETKVIEDQKQYDKLINDPFVQRGLTVLGINLDPEATLLTPKQLAAGQIMMDVRDGRSDIKKLRDLGISSQTWDNWLKDPTFQKFLTQKTGNLFEDQLFEVDRALFLKARTGNVEAIKLVNAIRGRHQQVEVPKIGPVEANVFVMRLFEILQNHLIKDHPEMLKSIGEEILAIQNPYLQVPSVVQVVTQNVLVANEAMANDDTI